MLGLALLPPRQPVEQRNDCAEQEDAPNMTTNLSSVFPRESRRRN